MSLCQASFVYLYATSPVVSLDDEHHAATRILDETPNPLSQLIGAERRRLVAAFLGRLAPRDRDIVRALFWRGASQRTVADRLGISQPAVAKALRRILDLGRRELAHMR